MVLPGSLLLIVNFAAPKFDPNEIKIMSVLPNPAAASASEPCFG